MPHTLPGVHLPLALNSPLDARLLRSRLLSANCRKVRCVKPTAPPPNPLPADTRMGRVFLRVRDLDESVRFYREAIGLQLISHEGDLAVLGAGGRPLVGLLSAPLAPLAPRAPGLYHLALLLPSREELGAFLSHSVRVGTRLDGASDHAVSEAIYLRDPEGNGIEVYRDRPRHEWRYNGGRIDMVTLPLDARAVLAAGAAAGGAFQAPAGSSMGHVHLQVADLTRAKERYSDALGFPITHDGYAGALFLAAGGYHHHLGLNSWGTAGREPAQEGSLGLAWFEVVIQDAGERAAARERLAASTVNTFESPEGDSVQVDADGIGLALVEGNR